MLCTYIYIWVFLMAQQVKNPPAVQKRRETWVWSLSWDDLLEEEKWQATPVFLLEKSHGQRNLEGYSLWGHRVGYDWTTDAHTHVYICINSNTSWTFPFHDAQTPQGQFDPKRNRHLGDCVSGEFLEGWRAWSKKGERGLLKMITS